MKVVILAGGLGSRISEETDTKPKPMIEIGGKPILWHIMKIFSAHGLNEFIICCGYKGYIIKEYFLNYFHHSSDFTIDLKNGEKEIHNKNSEQWKITLIDTGLNSGTGGRLLFLKDYLKEDFCMTYGDGLGSINIGNLIKKHKESKLLATVTAVKPPGRFGSLALFNGKVKNFIEKPEGDNTWINGGFFVFSPKIIKYIETTSEPLEARPLQKLAIDGQLGAYKHSGFWQPMDTLRDKNNLQKLWNSDSPPWKVW
jgi:glucose-1-phosphate cytidylyltransferase